MSTTKSQFEKIRSLVERRKLFESLMSSKAEMICKGDGDHLFTFTPRELVTDVMVQGALTAIDKVPQEDTDIIGNFTVGEDRYFLHGKMRFLSGEGLIHLDSDVFKLQRRATHRIQISPEFPLLVVLTKHKNSAVYAGAMVTDISAGGVRLHFYQGENPITSKPAPIQDPGFQTGDTFNCVIHPPSGKTIEVSGIVRHKLDTVVGGKMISQFGCEFQNLTTLLKNRLLVLTLDLQRKLFANASEK